MGQDDRFKSLKVTIVGTNSLKEVMKMDSLVTASWLSRHLDDPDLVVLDCSVCTLQDENGLRNVSGRADYERGHIPSAGFADLTTDLADASSSLEFAMPTPEQFCAAMGALGVGDDSRVVLYDGFMVWSARVWWMLRWVGFDHAAILDGGINAWTQDGRPIATAPVNGPGRCLTGAIRPHLIADKEEVLAAIGNENVRLIDTMPEDHFRGEDSLYARAGHIPGAQNISALELFDESGRYRSHEDLAALFGGDPNARTITYCGGGIAAAAAAFVMTRLGYTDVAVYAASLQEWAADPSNPLVVGVA